MTRIGALSGTGKLRTDEKDFGSVNYSLNVWLEPSGFKRADGRVAGKGAMLIDAAMNARGTLLLDLETGGHVQIILTKASLEGGEFVVSGPVPGI